MIITKQLIEESRADAIQDCDELLWLIGGNQDKLIYFSKVFKKERLLPMQQKAYQTYAFDLVDELMRSLQAGATAITSLKKDLVKGVCIEDVLVSASAMKQEWGMHIRSTQGIVGSLMVSMDWQSPSYNASVTCEAGSQRGKIIGTENDYKRDHHLDAYPYERAFVREYIDAPLKAFVRLYATSSGMAAFTTALNFLVMEKKIRGPVIMGANAYFENKELIEKMFAGSVIEVDESDTLAICQTVKKYAPRILFFDTIANSENISTPDIDAICNEVAKHAVLDTYMVIDNTCASVFYQPCKTFRYSHPRLHFLVIESLNKFHQFGMDRVTGGIVWGYGRDMGKLFGYRMHLGTNIPDASVHALPRPNRKRLERRLRRLSRNALTVARELQEYISTTKKTILQEILYPGLSFPVGNKQLRDCNFCGSFFALKFKEGRQSVSVYQHFIKRVIDFARQSGVSVVAGTSFGFSTTRVYLTALRATATHPFVRISPGAETAGEIQRLLEVFKKAVTFY